MKYKLVVAASAEHDLDEIILYIAVNLGNPKAAAGFADALDEKYSELEEQPFMFELSRNAKLADRGYRRFVVNKYVVLYLVNEERREVSISRIFYGKRNYEKYI